MKHFASSGGWLDTLCRSFAASFALWPLVVYIGAASMASVGALDATIGISFCATAAALPFLIRFPRALCALYYLVVDTLATVSLFSVAASGELPTTSIGITLLGVSGPEVQAVLMLAWPAAAGLVVCAAVWGLGILSMARRAPTPWKLSRSIRALLASPVLLAAIPAAQASYPLTLPGVVRNIADFAGSLETMPHDAFEVKAAHPTDQVVVLVIGESASAKHWQLNGYARATTPFLTRRAKRGELANFRAHMSTSAVTTLALPALLNPFEDGWRIRVQRRRLSIVSVMARAGYRTAWFTSQDAPLAAREAGTMAKANGFLEMKARDTRYDQWLVPKLGEYLNQAGSGPTFVVLHTMGNHFAFQQRYPETYAKWTADGFQHMPAGLGTQTRDNYDNTVLYSDFVLESIIERLESERRPVLLAYVSDHAEVAQYQRSWRTGALRDEWALNVPFFFWCNTAWKTANAQKWAALQEFAASGQPTSHLNVVPTVADLLEIDYDGLPRERDILSPRFKPWTRTPAIAVDPRNLVDAAPPVAPRLLPGALATRPAVASAEFATKLQADIASGR